MSVLASQVQIASGQSIGSFGATGAQQLAPGAMKIEVRTTTSERAGDAIDDILSIYGEPSLKLGQAVMSLTSAIDICREAISFERDNDRIRADSRMVDLQAKVAELFSYRSIGDGFSAVIAALMFMFVNKAGLPFRQPEMFAILRTINSLLSAPYCSIESAVGIVQGLEDVGLVIDSKPLSDLLAEAQEAGFVDAH